MTAKHFLAVILVAACSFLETTACAEGTVKIPKPSDWTDQGTVLRPGDEGKWDSNLTYVGPTSLIHRDGEYLLYYVGAQGERQPPFDNGPRWRAVGVATSDDGVHFTKYANNPVIEHVITETPHGPHQEEGAGPAAAMLDRQNQVVLYYTSRKAANLTSINNSVTVAVSPDGKSNWTITPDVLKFNNPNVWGHGDELYPVSAYRNPSDGRLILYYMVVGGGIHGGLGVAQGFDITDIDDNAQKVFAERDEVKQGGGEITPLDDHGNAAVLFNRGSGHVEVWTFNVDSPEKVAKQQVYDDIATGVLYLDKDNKTASPLGTWLMFYGDKTGNRIGLKTAPVEFEN